MIVTDKIFDVMNYIKHFLLLLFPLFTATAAWADVEINETTFPDNNFRSWVLAQSYGQDGVLTDEEIARVTRMDLTTKKISNLKGIEFFTELTWLNCTNNQLTEIDLSKCTKLEHFDCNWTQLTELNLSKNIALTELTCSYNKLHSLDISKNKALIDLRCGGNQLTTLDVSNNSALEVLFCNENQLTELDLSMNSAIKRVWCSDNELTSLNVSGCVVLESLKCGRNRLKSLVLTNCAGLWELYCESNQINGKAMDEMVESLPILINIFGIIHVINHQNEQNVMTKAQVAAAKAKGWNPRYNDGTNYWNDYEGSEDTTGICDAPRLNDKGQMINEKWFDLQGRRLSGKPARGIYIEKGKKIAIK